jgi:type II secretory pathway component PulF
MTANRSSARDSSDQTSWRVMSLLMWVTAIVGLVSLLVQLFIVPRFEAVFEDMAVQLPSVTLFLLKCTSPFLFVPVVVLLSVILSLTEWLIKNRRLTFSLNTMVALGAIVWWIFALAALFLPMQSLVNASGGT